MPDIRYERVKLSDIKLFPGNARRGDLDVLKDSLTQHGQYRPIVVQESTGYILAGNNTWLAAEGLGWAELDVGIIDVDDEQAKRIVLVDNRSNDIAEYDDQALADLLTELDSLDGTGFEQDDLNALLASLGPGGFSRAELENVIRVPEDPVTSLGDVIALGPHVLYCADALKLDVLTTAEVDMVWTDPPYLVNYQTDLTPSEAAALNRRKDGKEITNEKLVGLDADEFRWRAANLIHVALRPGSTYYLHMPPGPDQALWIAACDAAGLEPRQVLQWVKNQFVFGRSDYHYRSEPILYGWRSGAAHTFNGDRTQDTVWEFDRPRRSKDHPTIKPVDLATRAIENSAPADGVILDPFAGSGTVMAACMQTGRRCIMVELDPAYCDVIVERYERLTGDAAIRPPATKET